MLSATATWDIRDDVARLSTSRLQLEVDLRDPTEGASCFRVASQELDVCLYRLITDCQAKLSNAFVRGDDLVVNYYNGQSDELQFDWRLLAEDQPIGFDLVVSLQVKEPTQCLNVELESILGTRSVWFPGHESPKNTVNLRKTDLEGNAGFLSRYPEIGLSCAQVILPQDALSSCVELTKDAAIHRQQLSWGALEKGVIRRCRLRACFVPSQDDIAQLTACYEGFLRSPIPLSA